MGAVEVFYRYEHGNNPVLVDTPEEVDAVIEAMRAESTEAAPMLLQAYADPDAGELAVGIVGDRGVIRYAGEESPLGAYSTGDGECAHFDLAYYYMGNWTGFPSNAEIPLEQINRAFKQYVATGGKQPTGIRWQTGPEVATLEDT